MPTKKDYVTVAAILHTERREIRTATRKKDGTPTAVGTARLETVRRIEARLTAYFQADNPLFNPERFVLASGALKKDTEA